MEHGIPPSIYCQHSRDSPAAEALLRDWLERGIAKNSTQRRGWLTHASLSYTHRTVWQPHARDVLSEWLVCGVHCRAKRDRAAPCQRAWPGMRR